MNLLKFLRKLIFTYILSYLNLESQNLNNISIQRKRKNLFNLFICLQGYNFYSHFHLAVKKRPEIPFYDSNIIRIKEEPRLNSGNTSQLGFSLFHQVLVRTIRSDERVLPQNLYLSIKFIELQSLENHLVIKMRKLEDFETRRWLLEIVYQFENGILALDCNF